MQEITTGIVFGSFALTICAFLTLQILWNGVVRRHLSVVLFLLLGMIWSGLAIRLRIDQLNQRMATWPHEWIAAIMVLQGWVVLYITLYQAQMVSEKNRNKILTLLFTLSIISASSLIVFPLFLEPPRYIESQLVFKLNLSGVILNIFMLLVYLSSFLISLLKQKTRARFLIPSNFILLYAIITPLFPDLLNFPPRVTWMAIAAFFLTYAVSQKDLLLEQNLAREELKTNLEKAKTETKSMSRFLAMMTHEIRNPLGGMSGLISLMAQTRLSQEQKIYIDNMKNSAASLNMLLNNLLDYSKLEEGQMQLEEVEFDTTSLVEETFELVFAQADAKSLKLNHTKEIISSYLFLGDITKIRQILLNLLTNAIKFSSNGIVNVISKEREMEGSKFLEFTVIDQGIGMSPEVLSKLFKDYVQADPSIARQYGGTGLGLAICKRLSVLMGGDIYVKSERGKGSAFTFRVQIKTGKRITYAQDSFQDRNAIVIGEDCADEVLINTLKEMQVQTTYFKHPMDAIGFWKNSETNNPNYIFISYEIPIINGLKLLTILFTQRRSDQSKVIIIKNTATSLEENEQIQVSAVLNRPLRKRSIRSALTNLNQEANQSIESETNDSKNEYVYSVMLVDDDSINQMVGKRILEIKGCKVTIRENGELAVLTSMQTKFDFILMDIHMPVMDGYTASRQIKVQGNPNMNTPIFALSAESESELANSLHFSGMNGFIPKPFGSKDVEKLIDWIQKNKG